MIISKMSNQFKILSSGLILSLLLTGCATHPSFIEGTTYNESVDCSVIDQKLIESELKYNEEYQKQEWSHSGDIILITLIGLPLMPDHEDDYAKALGEYQYMLGKKNSCKMM